MVSTSVVSVLADSVSQANYGVGTNVVVTNDEETNGEAKPNAAVRNEAGTNDAENVVV